MIFYESKWYYVNVDSVPCHYEAYCAHKYAHNA